MPNGLLIDLRPIMDQWHIEVVSSRETHEIGRVQDFPAGLADDEAANQAMKEAEKNHWYKREHEEFFPLYYSWDSANEMEEWIEEEWEGFIGMDTQVQRAVRSAWALADADARVRLRIKMLITKWRVIK